MTAWRTAVAVVVAGMALVGCTPPAREPGNTPTTGTGTSIAGPSPSASQTDPPASVAPPATLLAVGDIASCRSSGDEATAAILSGTSGIVATLGDTAYPDGSPADFARCYAPSWGRYRDRTRPTPGNHDYHTPGAAGYFGYFGTAAGDPAKGYYSYDLGAWHIVVVNSNCDQVGGCHAGSPQERWLRADLAASPRLCTLAYWYDPLFTSGAVHPGYTPVRPIFRALYQAGAEVVLSGHNHQYERFAPQTPSGRLDRHRGIRQFVVGTGGVGHYRFGEIQPNSEARDSTTYGLLRLTLHPDRYEWRFLPAVPGGFTDAGSARCH